jgi:endoglycosylceramidase
LKKGIRNAHLLLKNLSSKHSSTCATHFNISNVTRLRNILLSRFTIKKIFNNTLAACLWICGSTSYFISCPSIANTLNSGSSVSYITDTNGRALILHGLNTSNNSKYHLHGMPWITASDVVAENNTLGTNAVRFVIFWDLVEPQPGVYDDNYLSNIKTRVNWYGSVGMHVILDMHQDLYGPGAVRVGPDDVDGAPVWATYTDGLAIKSVSPWSLMYLQPGEMRAWDNFWGTTQKHPELRQMYANAWQHVAGYFADNKAIIGYDLMNEPYGGTLQGVLFEPTVLLATYQTIINKIRQVDNDHWIFVEPSAFPVTEGLPTTLPKPHDPRKGEPHIVYSPHLYPPTLTLDNTKSSYTGLNIPAVNLMLATWTASTVTVAALWKAPIAIGELGAINYRSKGNLAYVDRLTELTDHIGASWLWWSNDVGDTGPYQGNGVFNDLAAHLSYPYPQAIAGTPKDLQYDRTKKQLRIRFANKTGVTGTTDLFLSPYVFINGYTITTTDVEGTWNARYNATNHVLSITADPTRNEHNYTVTAI